MPQQLQREKKEPTREVLKIRRAPAIEPGRALGIETS
jgi:hypothetical protein